MYLLGSLTPVLLSLFPDGKQGAGRFNLDAIPLGGGKRRTSIEKEITRRGETQLNGYEVLR